MEYRAFLRGLGMLFLITAVAGNECGGKITDPVGILVPTNLTANSSCVWTFEQKSNSSKLYLAWNFLSLLPGDYLAVFNTSSPDNEHPVANFTGTSENTLFYSGAQNVSVVFYSKLGTNETDYDVHIHYNTKSCNLTVSAESGVIHSPLYNETAGNLNCTYVLSMPAKPNSNSRVAITFRKLDLGKGKLDIYDGNSTKQPLVAGYTDGAKDVSDVISSGRSLTLSMLLPLSSSQEWFAAAFTSVSEECSGVVNISLPQNVSSPGFPGNYSNGLNCRWLLIAPENMTLNIRPLNFHLGDDFDHVTFVDGYSKSDRLIETFSQSRRPENGSMWMSSGRHLWIQFISDEINNGPGFNFDITPVDYGGALIGEGTFSVESADISTHVGMEDLVYTIIVEDGKQVELMFNDTNRLLYPTSEMICYDGISNRSNVVGKFMTNTPFRPVYSNTNIMMLVIKGFVQNSTHQNMSREHFSGYYRGVSNNGTFVNSIGPAGSYQLVADGNELNATAWFVHNHVGGTVALRISKLHIAGDHMVTVHSGLAEESLAIATFHNSSNNIPVIYVPDARITYKLIGQKNDTNSSLCDSLHDPKETLLISASYEINPVSSQNISAASGTIGSPNYPDEYPFNAQFSWNISIPQNKSRRVGIQVMSLAMNHSIQIEGKTYYNNTHGNQSYILENSTDYGSFMGSSIPDDIVSEHDELWVTFSSLYDGGNTVEVGKGFLAEFETIDCGGIVSVPGQTKVAQSVSTPGYPDPVTEGQTCVWILEAPQHVSNTSVNVINYKYEIKGYTNDSGAQLKIRDGGSVSSPEVPLQLPGGVSDLTLARGNKLWIRYSGSSAPNSKPFAFKLSYELYECGEKEQCSNGVCMHKDWKCNGVDNCGDGSDEKDCTCTEKGKGGIAPWALALAIILTILATVALMFIVPAIYKRLKYPNYSELRDLMTPVPT